jgi:hypothetical protein
VRRSFRISVACLALLGASACRSRNPCRELADRDCARYGAASVQCREARDRAATEDEFLTEVCRRVLAGGRPAWRSPARR